MIFCPGTVISYRRTGDGKCPGILTHTASVSLLFHPAGGQDCINHLPCVDSNRICPSAETVTVPFQIFLMIWRHMFHYRGVLAAPAMETAMRGDPVVMIKYFNRCFCYAHIDLIVANYKVLTFLLTKTLKIKKH